MKKLISIWLIFCLVAFVGCASTNEPPKKNQKIKKEAIVTKENEYRAIWLSYLELSFAGKSEEEFESDMDARFDNIKNAGLNTIILHVRANGDAIYPSDIFPFSATAFGGETPSFDPLEYMVSSAKEKGLRVEAWINPYRISGSNKDLGALSEKSPARIWLEDEDESNDKNVLFWGDGIYLNPASDEVRQLIKNGISELLEKYDIDGIQFDDYFYPTADPDFDKESYNEYKASGGVSLSLSEWRRTNVSLLLSECYKAVHKYEGKTFGISPAAAISTDKKDKNYAEYFADIYAWMENEGYIDYIAPQLYFGFDYPDEAFQFDKLLELWTAAEKAENIKLYIGLAAYKIGLEDSGSREWIESEGILSRQITKLRNSGANGYILYSYSGVFSENAKKEQELEMIKEMN